jgi:hypothetical protein
LVIVGKYVRVGHWLKEKKLLNPKKKKRKISALNDKEST